MSCGCRNCVLIRRFTLLLIVAVIADNLWKLLQRPSPRVVVLLLPSRPQHATGDGDDAIGSVTFGVSTAVPEAPAPESASTPTVE